MTAGFLSRNWLMIPHVTHHDDADITALESLRKEIGARYADVKITPLAFFVKALVAALTKFPRSMRRSTLGQEPGVQEILPHRRGDRHAARAGRAAWCAIATQERGRDRRDIAAMSAKARAKGLADDGDVRRLHVDQLAGRASAAPASRRSSTHRRWRSSASPSTSGNRSAEDDAIEWRLMLPLSPELRPSCDQRRRGRAFHSLSRAGAGRAAAAARVSGSSRCASNDPCRRCLCR